MRCQNIKNLDMMKSSTKRKDDNNKNKEKLKFVASSFASSISSDSCLIDSGCTNHMTSDEKLFERLDKTTTSRVRIGNGEYLPTKGKWTVAIEII